LVKIDVLVGDPVDDLKLVYVIVVLTVLVTPVGNVVSDTVGVPPRGFVPVIVNVVIGVLELDDEIDPDVVWVLEFVVDADTVGVSFLLIDCTVEKDTVGVADCVFELCILTVLFAVCVAVLVVDEELVVVGETVDVFDADVEPENVPDSVDWLLVDADLVVLELNVAVVESVTVNVFEIDALGTLEYVVDPVDVLDDVVDPVSVADTVLHLVITDVLVIVIETIGVIVVFNELVTVDDPEDVLDCPDDLVFVAVTWIVTVGGTENVVVFETIFVLDNVVDAVCVLDVIGVRESDELPVEVFDDVIDDVAVLVITGELVFFEVILKLGDAELVLDGFILAVFVTLEVVVRDPGADFVSDGLAEFVLLVPDEEVLVFDLISVWLFIGVDVEVLLPAADIEGSGDDELVLEEDVVFEEVIVPVCVFVLVEDKLTAFVGNEDFDNVVVLVDVFELVAVELCNTSEPINTLAFFWSSINSIIFMFVIFNESYSLSLL